MRLFPLVKALKALRSLGPSQVGLYGIYRLGLASGYYRRFSQPSISKNPNLQLKPIFPMPDPGQLREVIGPVGLRDLLLEADEIVDGNFREFGGDPHPISLTPLPPLAHWTHYEKSQPASGSSQEDIKFTWEPARFGWAFVLGRAYHLTQNETYARAFWEYFETFQKANPAFLGPNWSSGQEAGLRLMAFAWMGQLLASSSHSTPARLSALAEAVAIHASRIPPTLVYARSQNNNHLLAEAAALTTAALTLPDHPSAPGWLALGRKWLAWCFTHQIDSTGEYVQYSMNYQRLMLQIALWINAISPQQDFPGAKPARNALALAAGWMISRLDPISGTAPNLGANDGALIFPLSTGDVSDYRPVTAAAARAFRSSEIPAGAWDEMSLWFGLELKGLTDQDPRPSPEKITAEHSWASLRAVRFISRPSHADLLHCELWWHGLNIARDAGTYRYNADPPWDNRLTSTLVHNTVSINQQEQMTRAGRFLYLDWADAVIVPSSSTDPAVVRSISAQTRAYKRFHVLHQRTLSLQPGENWLVEDQLIREMNPAQKTAPVYRLHWLLPDWEWQINVLSKNLTLRIKSPSGWIDLEISASEAFKNVGLYRAGNLIHGAGLSLPVAGWFSPTYDVKKPALALAVEVQSALDVSFQSRFIFPDLTVK